MLKIEANIIDGFAVATVYIDGRYIGKVQEKGRGIYRAYVPQGELFQPVAPSYKNLREAIGALQAMNEGCDID